ncbi:MAG: cation diffusion facilitator family transporter [Acidocella sp.]|jgi:cation diffusion facilitator family transporter|nr:cation diffusion facilitator family transporter [Acidocella sp.]OYY03405.1 MAG: cation-efflux pump [Acidocella sp. 35-58-6]
MKPVIKFACGSIFIGLAVLALKFLAARVSGSTALFSDALESLVNVAASLLALYALVVAAKPADRQHTYGHAKVELLSAVATGAMILIAAVLIFQRAFTVIRHPVLLAPLSGGLGLGMVLNAAAGGLIAIWAMQLRRVGKKYRSPALAADAQHLLTDVLTTIGIILGLGAADILHLPILDPILAFGIAVQIAFAGGATVLKSLSGLLDEAPPVAVIARINELVRLRGTGALEAHDFRIRQAGPAAFLEFHLVVPGAMSVDAAHVICDRIEAALRDEMPGVIITIHVEPAEKAKHEGVLIHD